MNFTIQRFYPGHANYSEASIIHGGQYYKATFGKLIDSDGVYIHYTMERRDTLIPEGTYKYCFYNSPINGWVILLKDVPGYDFIEWHRANWPFQLKGCTAHGLGINEHVPAVLQSRKALEPLFDKIVKASGKILAGERGTIIDGDFGTITYETLQLVA